MPTRQVVVIDGPPATGKTTLSWTLGRMLNALVCHYKRLGFANRLAELLIRMEPSVREREDCQRQDPIADDPVMLIDRRLIKSLGTVVFLSEVIYKAFQYVKILLTVLVSRIVIVDEGPCLGWANYLNLLERKCMNARQVALLIKLDIKSLSLLSKIYNLSILFLDRDYEELSLLWNKRGHNTPYPSFLAQYVRSCFGLLNDVCANMTNCNCYRYILTLDKGLL